MKFLVYSKLVIYTALAVVIFALNEMLIDKLGLVVGPVILFTAFEAILYDIVKGNFYKNQNMMAYNAVKIVLAVLMIIGLEGKFETVCIIWGVLSMYTSLLEGVHWSSKIRISAFAAIPVIYSAVGFVCAILLIINPEEHVLFHIILLGIDIIIEGLRGVITSHIKIRRRKKEEAELA